MTVLRTHATGTDGTVPGIGGCPFDMERVQKDYVDGAITPTKIINFGQTGDSDPLSTGISMQLNSSTTNATGQQILEVLAYSGFFESSTLSFRVPNLQKPGAARASDVWVAIPNNRIVPKLVQKLHQGAIDTIIVASLAFLETGGDTDKPTVVQVQEFSSCYIKFVDPLSYGFLSVFSFSFLKVKITQLDFKTLSSQGNHELQGSYVYEFNYDNASGTQVRL